jgi:hypothetical protein
VAVKRGSCLQGSNLLLEPSSMRDPDDMSDHGETNQATGSCLLGKAASRRQFFRGSHEVRRSTDPDFAHEKGEIYGR